MNIKKKNIDIVIRGGGHRNFRPISLLYQCNSDPDCKSTMGFRIVRRQELKPCPFCGKQATLKLEPSFGSDNPDKYWSIVCTCAMGSPDAFYPENAREEIIKDYNTRAF